MSKILNMVQYLLESEAESAKFVEVKGDPKIGPAWIMHVKELGKDEWDYFSTNVKLVKNDVLMNDKLVGTLTKVTDGYRVIPPAVNNDNMVGNIQIVAPTKVEAIFQFIKYYFASI